MNWRERGRRDRGGEGRKGGVGEGDSGRRRVKDCG